MNYESPLLSWAGAVRGGGVDAAVAWHYGDPLGEQRRAVQSAGLLDLSHRDVLSITGPDRLGWLHAICSQHVSGLRNGESTEALVLSMNGHVEQHWILTELDDQIWLDTEAGRGADALAYLQKMRFLKQVDIALRTSEWAELGLIGPAATAALLSSGVLTDIPTGATALPGGGLVRVWDAERIELIVPRGALPAVAEQLRDAGAVPVGSWAADALRVERRRPRLGLDTDHRTLAHEAGWIGRAVHLDKGCYRGQETVARVQNLGKPPRRLVLLHLGGESDQLPEAGTAIERDGRAVGVIGTAVHHHELGPVALALVKRTVAPGDQLTVAGQSAAIDRADAPGTETVLGFAGRRGAAATAV